MRSNPLPPTALTANKPDSKPILGFGPIGWIAAAIALCIVALALTGYDFQYHFIWLIHDCLGSAATMWYVTHLHIFHGLSLQNPYFSLIGAAFAVAALFIAPRPAGWWRYALIIFWGVIRPALLPYEANWLISMYRWLLSFHLDVYIAHTEAWLCMEFITSALLWTITGSRMVLVISTAASAAVFIFLMTYGPIGAIFYRQPEGFLLCAFWNGTIGGALLWWAIRARVAIRPERACPHCGYDLQGLPHNRCPECGTTPSQPIATVIASKLSA